MLCGVTLHLASRGPYLWEELELGDVGTALNRISDHGLELLRLPLVWESFQPRPLRVLPRQLDALVEILDLASAAHLQVLPWLFVGSWRGLNQLPAWSLGPLPPGPAVYTRGRHRRLPPLPIWSDPALLDAQRLWISELCHAVAGHPALWGWEVASAPEAAFGPAPREIRVSWIRRHAEMLAEWGGGLPVGAGIDAREVVALGGELAPSLDWFGIVASTPPPSPDPRFPFYLASLVHWLTGRRAVLPLPSSIRSVEAGAESLQFESLAAWIAEAWSDADETVLRMEPYLERQREGLCGLVTAEGKPKASLEALKGWMARSASLRHAPPPVPPPQGEVGDPLAGLSLPPEPKPRSSPLLLLPGQVEFNTVAWELQLGGARPPDLRRSRGQAPAWADVEPSEVEREPDRHVERLFRKFLEHLFER